jgi:hypothetical protein
MCRFSNDPVFLNSDPRERGHPFAKECQRLLNVRDISLTTIQACVLLGAFAITEGEAGGESVLYCIACRIAQLLDLPHRPAADKIKREVNIRGILYLDPLRDLTNDDSLVDALYDRRLVFHRRWTS